MKWSNSIELSALAISDLASGCLQYRSDEQAITMQKLDYVTEFMT